MLSLEFIKSSHTKHENKKNYKDHKPCARGKDLLRIHLPVDSGICGYLYIIRFLCFTIIRKKHNKKTEKHSPNFYQTRICVSRDWIASSMKLCCANIMRIVYNSFVRVSVSILLECFRKLPPYPSVPFELSPAGKFNPSPFSGTPSARSLEYRSSSSSCSSNSNSSSSSSNSSNGSSNLVV